MRTSNGRGWSRPGTMLTGNDFLPDTSTHALPEMIAACPSGKVRDILRACYEREEGCEHMQDTRSADAAVLYRAGVALEGAQARTGQHI